MEIIQQIINVVAGAATTGIVALCTWLLHRHRQGRNADALIRAGMMALLHDRIYQAAHYYCEKQGWCSLEDKHNIEYLYKPYAALGGNGTGESAYKAIMALPTESPKKSPINSAERGYI